MAVGIIDGEIPDAFVAVLRGVVEVEAHVEPVIGRQRDVVGPLIDEFPMSIPVRKDSHPFSEGLGVGLPFRQRGHLHILRGQRHVVSRVVGPGGIHLRLLAEAVAQREVQLVTVVELVGIPLLIEVVEAALVPRQRVGQVGLQALRAILRVELQSVEAAAAHAHQLVPALCWRHQSAPRVILQQVAR